jgi:hypothetical protein
MRFICVTFLLALGLPAIARDWARFPPVVELDTNATVFAIGDVHSDYDRLVKLLAAAKLIEGKPDRPRNVKWTGGKSVLIFTGDMIDKGPHALLAIALIRFLGEQARQQGGAVIALAGNHEAEFLADPTAKKSADFRAELKAAGIKSSEVAACGGELGEWMCNLPFAARINGWFFCHAGNTGGRTIKQIASDIEAGVDKVGFRSPQLVGPDSLLEARLGDRPWFEESADHDPKKLLAADAAALGVAHIVEGHQPGEVRFPDGVTRHAGEMFQRYGLLFLIDTGMSSGVDNSHGAALRISGNQAVAVCPDGLETVIWDRGDHAQTGRALACPK